MSQKQHISILLNGQSLNIDVLTTLQELVSHVVEGEDQGYVAALNNHIVPRSEWTSCKLNQDDTLSLFQAVAGG